MSANKFNNSLEEFHNSLYKYLANDLCDHNEHCLLVKRHSDKLKTHGDFSFVNNLEPWREYIEENEEEEEELDISIPNTSYYITDQADKENDLLNKKPHNTKTLLVYRKIKTEDIIQESKKWHLKVASVKVNPDRVYLFLDRANAIKTGLAEAINLHKTLYQRVKKGFSAVRKDPKCSYSLEPTYLRMNYLMAAIRNLCAVCLNGSAIITVSCKSSTAEEFKGFLVQCNNVLNAKTGAKEKKINSEEFVRMRQTEMSLIAKHKYGVKVETEQKWKEFTEHLGQSAAIFEMLQINYANPIRINFENIAAGASKGASFVLYNCARLETILKTFNEKVEDGTYPPLPEFDDVDLTTLTDEDEWSLIFTYIMALPSLLNKCVELRPRERYGYTSTCKFRPHLICGYLSSLARGFSQYYRRVRILTEPRSHMLPVLYARIYMLRALQDTIKICLKILNIKSVSQM